MKSQEKKKKVLIIEDDYDIQEATATFLAIKNYEVISAEDGTSGIKQALKHIPDLILCDITMPELDGYQVFDILQSNESTNHIPFVFLTAKTEKTEIRTGMQMGADDYITKPFDFEELLATIQTRIQKREKLLQIPERKFNVLADNPSVAIFVLQEPGFVFVSDKMLEITGHSREQLLKMSLRDLVEEKKRDYLYEKVERILKGLLNNIQEQFQIKNSKNNFIQAEIFAKSANLLGVKSLVGSIIIKNSGDIENYLENKANKKELENAIQKISKNKNFSPVEAVNEIEKKVAEKILSEKITKREQEVLQLICKGKSTQEIADELFISSRTVDRHRANLLHKTNAKNLPSLIVFAIKNGLVYI